MAEEARVIDFKDFKLIIKPAEKPDSFFVSFKGGVDVDGSGWESSSGDRKKIEDDFKFMFNPFDAPSNVKGEFIVQFRLPERKRQFFDWVDKQKKMFYGIEDDR